jgi:hypothetical protein
VLPGRVRKSGKVTSYDRVGRSLSGKRSGKLFGRDLINPIRYILGTTRVATRVRRWITCSGTTQLSNSGKVPGNDSGKESGMSSDKDLGKRPGKGSCKVIWSGKTV